MSLTTSIALTIKDGFDRHYRLFRETSAAAKARFEQADWVAARAANTERIKMYDQRVAETVATLAEKFPTAGRNEALWRYIKLAYVGLLYDHHQPECAETFYNSVACRVLHQRYYRNEYIFWRPAISTEHLDGTEPTYRCYYPQPGEMAATLRAIVTSFGLANPFEDLERDIGYLVRAVDEHYPEGWTPEPNFQIQVLSSLFYRNKAAYVVGRAVNGASEHPFVVPILSNADGTLFVDALLMTQEPVGRIFSLVRAYFMVDMQVPSAYVAFLQALMPSKPKAELYTLLGLQKQGKTLFYRDLQQHLKLSTDAFVLAPGTKGMVMVVFTLPSFPYVFKVIRDWFAPPKDADRRKVQDSYSFVKYHDRVGRMADTLEYSHVAFPKARFDDALLRELRDLVPSQLEEDDERVILKHMYIERRLTPLDVYLQSADDAHFQHGIREFGNAVKELAGGNVFPGDLLPKNFGVTRYGRVVFYDYDEICPLTACNFRWLPKATSDDDEMAGEPWFSVGPADVFPEQFPTFLFAEGRGRELFLQLHGDLADPAFWRTKQDTCLRGQQDDLFPYPQSVRFRVSFGAAQGSSLTTAAPVTET